MASWCWICRRKVDSTYRYYKGDKAHRKCIQAHKIKQILAKVNHPTEDTQKELKNAV